MKFFVVLIFLTSLSLSFSKEMAQDNGFQEIRMAKRIQEGLEKNKIMSLHNRKLYDVATFRDVMAIFLDFASLYKMRSGKGAWLYKSFEKGRNMNPRFDFNVKLKEAVSAMFFIYDLDYKTYANKVVSSKKDRFQTLMSAAYNLSIIDDTQNPDKLLSVTELICIMSKVAIVSENPKAYSRFDDGSPSFSVFNPGEIYDSFFSIVENKRKQKASL